jgi:miniconductance mechanosensitive channel
MENYIEYFKNIDYAQRAADIGIDISLFLGICLLAFVANYITKNVILRAIEHLILKSKTAWDDVLVERRVLRRLSHLAPALVFYFLIPFLFKGNETVRTISQRLASVYMLVVGLITIDAFLSAVQDIYGKFQVSKQMPIRIFVQVIKVLLYLLAAVIVISILIGKSPAFLIGSLGAMAAILMLVFRDPILSFAAGIQLSSNKMVQIGDWIEMPKYGVDGDVIDISLTTVRVQNFDKTIVTIPPYALVTDSFKNWRGMSEAGGRRIKRAIYLDMSSITFCNEEMIERFRKIRYISNYIEAKKKELSEYNKQLNIDDTDLANCRRMTNIGTFRAYIIEYLREHPKISKQMTLLVRQLDPGANGLPIEIYVFSTDTNWINYEGIQGDIFDHILAIIPEFGLKVFQNPTGGDFKAVIGQG